MGHGVDPYLGLDEKEAQVQLLLVIYLIILFRIYLLVFLRFIY